MFPLGEMSKPEDAMCANAHLAVAEKPNPRRSVSYRMAITQDLLIAISKRKRIDATAGEGDIVSTTGQTLSKHEGIHRFTVGQRRGIGIANERPLYVLSIDADKNRVVVGEQEELLSSEFVAAGVNWIALDEPDGPVTADVRVRYRHTASPAKITPLENNRARIFFDEPQRAITPGQATVFYRGDEVVGGGWIVRRESI